MLKIPLFAFVAAAVGCAVCWLAGVAVHGREIAIAAGATVIAGELAMAPMFFSRHATQAAIAQAALVATMIHLFGCVIAAAVIFLGKVRIGPSFSYWLIAMYFVTLIALVTILVRQVKAAPPVIAHSK